MRLRLPIGPEGRAMIATTALVFVARTATADDLDGVSWDAPPSCPDQSVVRGAIRQWLPSEGGVELRAIRVIARVKPHPAGYTLDLSFESKSGSGHETLVAARCETLADIVALKVALAADPVATLETESKPEEPRRLRKHREEPTRYGVRFGVGAGFGPLPDVALGGALVGSIIWKGARLELGAAYWFPKGAHYESLPDVGANFSLATGALRACVTPKLGPVELPTCAGLEAGAMRGTGFGVGNTQSADRAWVAVVFGPAIAIPLSEQLFLWIEGDAVLGVVRPSGYGMRNLDTLFRPEIGAARAWGGLEVRF